MEIISKPRFTLREGRIIVFVSQRPRSLGVASGVRVNSAHLQWCASGEKSPQRMIETSGVIEKEQGNGFYLVTLEQPAGHQCLCRAAGKLTKFRIKLLAGDKVLVEISPYDLTRGRITYRERNAGAPGGRPGGNRPGGPRRR